MYNNEPLLQPAFYISGYQYLTMVVLNAFTYLPSVALNKNGYIKIMYQNSSNAHPKVEIWFGLHPIYLFKSNFFHKLFKCRCTYFGGKGGKDGAVIRFLHTIKWATNG